MKRFLVFFTIFIFAFFFLPRGIVLATKSSLLCTPASGTYNIGDTITISYVLDTRGFPAQGADLVATYTPSVLQLVGTQSTPVTSVTNWTAPTTNTIDTNLGKIRLDYGQNQTPYTGNTTIGTATFKALAAGQAQFNFTFFQQYDNTTIAGGAVKVWGILSEGASVSNILTDVTNCMYVIGQSGPTATPGPTAGPTVPPVTSLPRSGTGEVTMSLLALAALFVAGGLIFPLYVASRA